MSKIFIQSIILTMTMAAGPASASEIYKWTDEEGNVHYSDRPVASENTEHMAIRSRPTDPAKVEAEVQARIDSQTERAEQAASAPRGPSTEELQAQAIDREEKCMKYRDREFEFTRARRIYRQDESGERVYYTEEEMADARQKVESLVNEYCN